MHEDYCGTGHVRVSPRAFSTHIVGAVVNTAKMLGLDVGISIAIMHEGRMLGCETVFTTANPLLQEEMKKHIDRSF